MCASLLTQILRLNNNRVFEIKVTNLDNGSLVHVVDARRQIIRSTVRLLVVLSIGTLCRSRQSII